MSFGILDLLVTISTLAVVPLSLVGWLHLKPELTLKQSSNLTLELQNIGKLTAYGVAPRSLSMRFKFQGQKIEVSMPESLESLDNRISRLAVNETLKIPTIPGLRSDHIEQIEFARFTLEITYRPILWTHRFETTKSWLVDVSRKKETIDATIRVGRHKSSNQRK